MRGNLGFLIATALISCHSAPAPQPGPAPEGTVASDKAVSLIGLIRTQGTQPGVPDYTLLFTASGEAFYSGALAIPTPGLFSGRISTGNFQHLASQLTEAGLVPVASGGSASVADDCRGNAKLALSLQVANGYYVVTTFCAGSVQEKALATPIYNATEAIIWQPGMRRLTLIPPK